MSNNSWSSFSRSSRKRSSRKSRRKRSIMRSSSMRSSRMRINQIRRVSAVSGASIILCWQIISEICGRPKIQKINVNSPPPATARLAQ